MLSQLVWPDPYNFDVADDIIGDLATGWEVSGDGTVYTFKLPQGVTWHDGQPFTASDVVFTLERGVVNPPEGYLPFLAGQLEALDSVTAPDDTTVVATLSRPSNAFLITLGMNFANMYPAHIPDATEFNELIIGTGPFKLESESGTGFELVRNEAYFKDSLPYLDGMTLFIIPDASAGLAAFRTGRIQTGSVFDNDYMVDQQDVIRADFPDVGEQDYLGGRIDLNMNNRGPLADRRVRQAISLGINRQVYNEVWQLGQGETLASPLIPNRLGGTFGLPPEEMRGLGGFDPDKADADLQKALDLLEQAGFGDGFSLELQVPSFSRYARGAEVVQFLLTRLNITAKLLPKDRADMTPDRLSGNFDIDWNSATLLSTNPLDSPGRAVKTNGSENWGKWSFPTIDALLEEQDRTLDPAERRRLLFDLQREILTELPIIPVIWWVGPVFWHAELKNFPRCFLGHSPCYSWGEVWFDR